jgi:hypothetical protein
MSILRGLGPLSKVSLKVQVSVNCSLHAYFLRWAPRPTPNLEDQPLLPGRGSLTTFHSWRPTLYPQPEIAPCYGDKGPT